MQISVKDSIIKEVKSTYSNSIKASNEALAEYNLKITDSLNAVVNKLKLDATNPQLLLAPLEKGRQSVFLTKDENKNMLNIQFISKGGTSYHILLYCYLLSEFDKGYIIRDSYILSMGEAFIAEDVLSTRKIEFAPDMLDYTDILIFITGSFSKDPQGKIIIPYNYAFNFNFKENKYIHGREMNFEQLRKNLGIKQ